MTRRNISTIGQHLYWSYVNLGMAHAALSKGESTYSQIHYIIRNKLYTGLCKGTMKLGSLMDDERTKLEMPRACCYCGSKNMLTLDHLIPASVGGKDSADNLVWACQKCNCSKGATDVLEWYLKIGKFPSLLLIRRYLKIVIGICVDNGWMGASLDDLPPLPFSLSSIPHDFPPPSELRLWITPI